MLLGIHRDQSRAMVKTGEHRPGRGHLSVGIISNERLYVDERLYFQGRCVVELE
jgi:hypothetical protein